MSQPLIIRKTKLFLFCSNEQKISTQIINWDIVIYIVFHHVPAIINTDFPEFFFNNLHKQKGEREALHEEQCFISRKGYGRGNQMAWRLTEVRSDFCQSHPVPPVRKGTSDPSRPSRVKGIIFLNIIGKKSVNTQTKNWGY